MYRMCETAQELVQGATGQERQREQLDASSEAFVSVHIILENH